MKKTKWMFILLLSTVMILATMQSAQAMGKSSIDVFMNIVDKDAPGTKYYGTLTIYYVGLPVVSGECDDNFLNAKTQMLFFVTLRKGNKLFWFSWKSETPLCLLDEGLQQLEIEAFKIALMKSIYNTDDPPECAVKSIDDYVDGVGVENNVVVGQGQNEDEITDLGFLMMNFCLAVQE